MAFQKLPALPFNAKVTNFPERVYGVYNNNNRLHKLMWAMLEVGLGQLDNLQLAAEIGQQSLSGTAMSELDEFFAFLGISRLPQEVYNYDAQRNPLTLSQWQEVIAKDSMFRMRILKFMQALTRGGTVEGLEMVAYAASGVKCRILETWRVSSGSIIDIPEWNGYKPDKNFLIVPSESITEQQKMAIIHLVDLVKPVDTVCSVLQDPLSLRKFTEVSIRWAAASNHYYTITRQITTDPSRFTVTDMSIIPNSTGSEVPTYAYMDTMDQEWDLSGNINSARATMESPTYDIKFAKLISSPDIDDATITVEITDSLRVPNSPVFTIKIDDEVMRVIDRKTLTDNQFEYTVLRGENGTEANTHIESTRIYTNIVVIETVIPVEGAEQSYWKDIPQKPNDVTEDANGHKIDVWLNQKEYSEWFKSQIYKLGGETSGEQYRFPLKFSTQLPDEEFRAEDAIAPPTVDVIVAVLPGANI